MHPRTPTLTLPAAALLLAGCISMDRGPDGYAQIRIDTHKKTVTLGEDGLKVYRHACNPEWPRCRR